MSIPQLGLSIDPLLWSILAGIFWTPIQAAFDRPWWTAGRRRAVVCVAALILGILIWAAGTYPATWQLILTQTGVILGAATAAFAILKRWGLIDWIGRVTPGGEAYQPKHAASTVTLPTVPETTAPALAPGSGDASPRAPADEGGVTAVPNVEGSSLEGEDHTA